MNLQENINRIHQMMGTLNEDKKSDIAFKMINDMGLCNAISYYGGYEQLKQFLGGDIFTREDKIDVIKDIIKHKYPGGLNYGDRDWPESKYDVIEKTKNHHILVFGYDYNKIRLTTFYLDEDGEFQEEKDFNQIIKYTDLSDDMIDKVFNLIINRC